jgi:hypothetical protein
VACVPTGMNCGVSTAPCGVSSRPRRARPTPVALATKLMAPARNEGLVVGTARG